MRFEKYSARLGIQHEDIRSPNIFCSQEHDEVISSILNERPRFVEEHFKNYQQIGKDSEALEPQKKSVDQGAQIEEGP